jgi:hypothetical protein
MGLGQLLGRLWMGNWAVTELRWWEDQEEMEGEGLGLGGEYRWDYHYHYHDY